jgi:transposase
MVTQPFRKTKLQEQEKRMQKHAIVATLKDLKPEGAAFRREFEVLPPRLVAIEAGMHSLWASQVLKVYGHDVLVGNPRKIRLITESDRKSDRVDAESLACLARADRLLLAPIQFALEQNWKVL